ncbi:4Fe-4S binding protein [Candidatus Formimonas warabiya]|uniref:Aldehyde:ferredoxin oxidoreductase n=1 Tax=Formimonas warabiya TaxID=1761012 RepID=A0A3G1KRB6_FORW1|nr:4Fe-4S binding protein [Candidatus Formimonas warabiya]ATW25022.1 aldehyde:ferredoxin oxidoreductase [Candidatus Formimonas warabiya]
MKRLVAKSELCIGCRLCEEVCSQAYRKEKNGKKSAIRIEENGDKGYIVHVCNQCGHCADICPVPAIEKDENGIVRIREDICVGCLTCVENCPTETMYAHDELTEPFKCIACGLCAEECPSGAIEIEAY